MISSPELDTLCLAIPQKLMQLPTISGSIEVWDFLSVDSQVQNFCFFFVKTLIENRRESYLSFLV